MPDVLPWQSLRKCAFAAPSFHRDDLPIPQVDSSSTPVVPTERAPAAQDAVSEPEEDFSVWAPTDRFEVEQILGATRLPNGGWRIKVKWRGYDEPTDEPFSRLARDLRDSDMLERIEECKDEYLAAHPYEQRAVTAAPPPLAPTRVQPTRERARTHRLVLHVSALHPPTQDDRWLVCPGLRMLRKPMARRSTVLATLLDDFSNVLPMPADCR